MFNNDATACYDHIIPSMAMLKCCHAGTPHSATNVVLKFLHCTKYHVHTTYGISVETFSNLIDYVLLELIQGTGHARPGWALTSSVMFNQMETTHRAHFHSPRPAQKCQCTGEAFVDDLSLWLLKLGLALTTIIGYMQQSAQKWERLLYATSGALNHTKCFWYRINWTFTDTGACKMKEHPDPEEPNITLTTSNSMHTYHQIQCMSPTKGIHALGIQLAPDGNDTDEFQYRIQQAMTIKQKLSKAPLGHEHMHISFQARW